MKNLLKKNKGITLVALVITIIILLILAGITITALTSENGLLKKTNEAKTQSDVGQEKEGIYIAVSATKMSSDDFSEISNTVFQKELDNYFGAGECVSEYDEEENAYIVEFKSGRKYTVNEDGTITEGIYEKWDGTTAQEPTDKTSNEIHIYIPAELKWLADEVNAGNTFEGYTVYLENNLDLGARKTGDTWVTEANENVEWTAIGGGTASLILKAPFEGKGHTIKGVYINKPEEGRQGIFGYADKVENLTIKDSYIHGISYVGGIVGSLTTSETITNCHNINTEVISEEGFAGGVIAFFNGGNASNCSNTGTVTNKGNFTGGIIGSTYSVAKIESSFNSGEITGADYTGGVVGFAYYADINNCYNNNTVIGDEFVGGIVGVIAWDDNNDSIVKNCHNEGKVIAITSQAGGIVGSVGKKLTIENCYNLGEIYSEDFARRNYSIIRRYNNNKKIF